MMELYVQTFPVLCKLHAESCKDSILGPILFPLYVNDMPLTIRNGRTVLFANDTNILCNKKP